MYITGFHSIEEKVRAAGKNSRGAVGISEKSEKTAGLKIYFSKPGPRVKKILAAAKEAGITCEQTSDAELDKLVSGLDETLRDHRGIVMEISGGSSKKPAANLVDFDSWVKLHSGKPGDLGKSADDGASGDFEKSAADGASGELGKSAEVGASGDLGNLSNLGTSGTTSSRCIVVILDSITDPHNVGAILRSCDQFGAALVIIPEHNSASDIAGNEVIGRTSAGASAWVPVAIVNNLVRAAEQLKQAGFWVYGADAGGQNCRTIDFAEKSVLIMGSEGTGIASLLEKQCDTIVSIPTCGKIDSLNVSVAAGVLLYELSK